MRAASNTAELADRFCRALGSVADVEILRADVGTWLDAVLRGNGAQLASSRDRLLARITASGVRPGSLVRATTALRAPLAADAAAGALALDPDHLIDRELAWLVERDGEAAIAAHQRSSELARVAAIQTLTSGFAHELRNPINAARLQLEVLDRELRRKEGPANPYEQRIATIEQELQRVTTLLDEFLAFAKPSALALHEQDITALAHEVLAAEAPEAASRGVTLAPLDAPAITGRVDGAKVRHVLRNLVRNAIEASDPGGEVTVAVVAMPGFVHIDVDDAGHGVPAEIRQRIYEPFFTTKHDGTGLGLAISRSIAAAHGGTVDLRPTQRGAKFRVMLPR